MTDQYLGVWNVGGFSGKIVLVVRGQGYSILQLEVFVMRKCVLGILLIFVPFVSLAATIHVPSDQATIQAGINVAVYGDTVLIDCGEYYVNDIQMKSGVCLKSLTGSADCVILDGGDIGTIMMVDGADPFTKIEGITFTNGNGIYNSGGAIYTSSSYTEYANCRFDGNGSSNRGGAITAFSDQSTFTDCQFEGNHSGSGGALYLQGDITFSGCSFSGNWASSFSGGAIYTTGLVTLDSCDFNSNNAVACILENGGSILNCTFVDNPNGGIVINTTYGITITNILDCMFTGNSAGSGAGVYFTMSPGASGECNISDCTFQNNTASSGGAVFLWGNGGSKVIENCTFIGNQAGLGGAIRGLDISVDNCLFLNNVATEDGGALWSVKSLELSSSTFYENSAVRGGNLFLDPNSGPYSKNIMNCLIANCVSGGALFCYSSSIPEISCTDIYGNHGGDWISWIADQVGNSGNINLDPLFCDPLSGNLNIETSSPCAPNNNDCGVLIGALPLGCTNVDSATWSEVKSLY